MDVKFATLVLLLRMPPVFLNEYILVAKELDWPSARDYCREFYTDLAVIGNQDELDEAAALLVGKSLIWIGLERNSTGYWYWSAGGEVTQFFWASNEPQSITQKTGVMYSTVWYDYYSHIALQFLCSNVDLQTERMTWMEALDFCKKAGSTLASPRNKTDLTLVGKELSTMTPSEHVWMGLYFFADKWLWLDGANADFRSLPQCPAPNIFCGALLVPEKLSSTSNYVYNWTGLSCDIKLQFICS